jgi:hypothetical protein
MSSKLDSFGAIALDNIEDVPGFKVPPAGEYEVDAECELKEINGNPAFVVNFTVTQPDGEGYLKGDKFGVMYTADGLKYKKEVVGQTMAAFGAINLIGCVEAGTIQARVVIKHRLDKNDKEKVYCEVVRISAV